MKRLLTIFLIAGIWSQAQAVTYPLSINFGPVGYDTILVVRYDGSLAPVDSFYTSGYSVDTTYEITSGLAQFLVKYKDVGDNWHSYREDFDAMLTGAGPIYWHVPVFIRDPVDSIVTDSYENGSLVSSAAQTVVNNAVDFYRLVVRDTIYRLTHRIFYAGRDSAISFVNTLHWDSLGTTIVTPPLARTCIIYGYIGNTAGLKTRDVTLTFTLPDQVNDTCNGTVIIDRVSIAHTDAVGYWADTLIWSSCLGNQGVAASSRAAYNVTIEYPNMSKITRQLVVPDSATHRVRW